MLLYYLSGLQCQKETGLAWVGGKLSILLDTGFCRTICNKNICYWIYTAATIFLGPSRQKLSLFFQADTYLGIILTIRKSNNTLAMSGIEVKEFSTMSAATKSRFSDLEQRSTATAPPKDLPKTMI